MDLFKEILPSLNDKTEHLLDFEPEAEKSYPAYMVNKAYSFGTDTILYANEMNRLHHLSNKQQYDFYYYGLDKRKRYNKWTKQDDINNLELVKEYYECSTNKARQYLKILTEDNLKHIRKVLSKE